MSAEFEPYVRPVYYYETDCMKIVHHSNYLRYFEEARLHYITQLGMPYATMEEEGIIIPVISASLDYRNSLVFGDTFRVYVTLTEYNGIKFSCSYRILKEGDEVVAATGNTSHCFLNREMKLFRFAREFPEYDRKFREAL
ncbi:MAG: acyl-CoA thioesterase [Lachnospiraceae bacterium]|nr:acyl-CoA thioesterase [Lachnospiraceae bacterium]